jgi:hypothetical protein
VAASIGHHRSAGPAERSLTEASWPRKLSIELHVPYQTEVFRADAEAALLHRMQPCLVADLGWGGRRRRARAAAGAGPLARRRAADHRPCARRRTVTRRPPPVSSGDRTELSRTRCPSRATSSRHIAKPRPASRETIAATQSPRSAAHGRVNGRRSQVVSTAATCEGTVTVPGGGPSGSKQFSRKPSSCCPRSGPYFKLAPVDQASSHESCEATGSVN